MMVFTVFQQKNIICFFIIDTKLSVFFNNVELLMKQFLECLETSALVTIWQEINLFFGPKTLLKWLCCGFLKVFLTACLVLPIHCSVIQRLAFS